MTHSWHVVCLTIDDDSPHDDCRQIETLGYEAPLLTMEKVDKVGAKIQSGLSAFHVTRDGSELQLEPATDGSMYVRTLDEDSPDDPLLGLPRKSEYEQQQRLEQI